MSDLILSQSDKESMTKKEMSGHISLLEWTLQNQQETISEFKSFYEITEKVAKSDKWDVANTEEWNDLNDAIAEYKELR